VNASGELLSFCAQRKGANGTFAHLDGHNCCLNREFKGDSVDDSPVTEQYEN